MVSEKTTTGLYVSPRLLLRGGALQVVGTSACHNGEPSGRIRRARGDSQIAPRHRVAGDLLTHVANDNPRWNLSATISYAINPCWILILSFPLAQTGRLMSVREAQSNGRAGQSVGCGEAAPNIAGRANEEIGRPDRSDPDFRLLRLCSK